MTTPDMTTTFEVTDWCDFARGVAEPGTIRRMRELLGQSEAARKASELFERVHSVAKSDQGAEIPSYALRVVKAVAGLGRPSSWGEEPVAGFSLSSFLRILPFHVTFDSLQAAQAGTREFSSSHQQITSFRARDFSIHVKLEQETNPHSQVVVGQLLHHGPEPRPMPDIPVLVLSSGRVVGRSLTSRFGEFQAEGLPPDPLKLCLLVGPEDRIDLPLGAHTQDA